MLGALARTIAEAAAVAKRPPRPGVMFDLATLKLFRTKVADFQALVIIVERRLKDLVDRNTIDELTEQFRRLEGLMLGLIVRATTRFFGQLIGAPVLPLGTFEICESQMRMLDEARTRIGHPALASRMQPGIDQEIELADAYLRDILDRMPALETFQAA